MFKVPWKEELVNREGDSPMIFGFQISGTDRTAHIRHQATA